jgi:uncharacterized membrane protein
MYVFINRIVFSGSIVFFSQVLSLIPSFLTAVALNIPMLIDGFTQKRQFRKSNNLLRIITGFLAGFGLSQFAVCAANTGSELILKWF